MSHVGISDNVNKTISDNYFNSFKQLENEDLFLTAYPNFPNVSITSICNMYPRCSMCFTTESGNHIDDVVLYRLKDSVFKYSLSIRFTIDGEPLVYPKISEVIDSIDGWVWIQTNGLSDKLRDTALLDKLQGVYISLDAATAETYKKFRPDYFQKVIDNIKFMVEYRKGRECLTVLRLDYILMQCTKHEVFDFIDLAYALGVTGVYISYLFPASNVMGDKSYHGEEFIYEDQIIPVDEVRELIERCVEYGRKLNFEVIGAQI